MHFFWKCWSPTARTSSRIRISGFDIIATVKPSRIAMPDEYVRTGWCRYSPSSAKVDELLVARLHLGLRNAEHRGVHVEVVLARELGVEAGAELEERAEPAVHDEPPRRRPRRPGEDLEQRALPRAVPSDDPERRAALELEADVLERPLLLVAARACRA